MKEQKEKLNEIKKKTAMTDRSIEQQIYRYLLVKKQNGRTCLRSAVLVYAKTSNLCDAGFCNYILRCFFSSSAAQHVNKILLCPCVFLKVRLSNPARPSSTVEPRLPRPTCECTNVCSAHRGCTLAQWHVSPSCAGFKWAAGVDIWRTKLKWSLIILWSASQDARCP